VVEPDVLVEAAALGLGPELADPARTAVVGGEGEEALVEPVHRLGLLIPVDNEADVLHAPPDLGFDPLDVAPISERHPPHLRSFPTRRSSDLLLNQTFSSRPRRLASARSWRTRPGPQL